MALCAVCGEEVGTHYARNRQSELVYCGTHSDLAALSNEAQVCLRCGQRVSRAFYTKNSCPNCGRDFEYEAARTPTLERLKKIGPLHFVLFDSLSCIVAGSIFFLGVHFIGRLITPIGTAVVLALVFVIPRLYTLTHSLAEWNMFVMLAIPGRALDLLSDFGFQRIKRTFVGKEFVLGDILNTSMWTGFTLGHARFSDASTLARLLMLIVATLFAELLWPGYFHNLLVTAVVALPSSVLDALLFQRVLYPIVASHLP